MIWIKIFGIFIKATDKSLFNLAMSQNSQQDFNIQQSPAKVILYNHTHAPVTQLRDFLRMNKTTAPKTHHIKRNHHKYFTLVYWQQNIREIIRI